MCCIGICFLVDLLHLGEDGIGFGEFGLGLALGHLFRIIPQLVELGRDRLRCR